MKYILLKIFGMKKLMDWYINVQSFLNSKYRKSLKKVNKNFREIDKNKQKELYNHLFDHYFSNNYSYLESDIGKTDMEDHILNRLLKFRYTTIPWINSLIELKQSKVLEIGCGTGSTSVTLAEQFCELTSIDVNDISIKSAKKRCELYNVSPKFIVMNATNINDIADNFDVIIFSATLEHMSYEERILSIKSAWDMLKDNGFIIVIETPNRLYHTDEHSSLLPFYNWLPDQIAMQYSKFSPREACRDSSSDEMKFIRFGRGVSFHEFEIALGIVCSDLEVYSMQSFTRTFLSDIIFGEEKYNKFLRKVGPPKTSASFYYRNLDIAIKKLVK